MHIKNSFQSRINTEKMSSLLHNTNTRKQRATSKVILSFSERNSSIASFLISNLHCRRDRSNGWFEQQLLQEVKTLKSLLMLMNKNINHLHTQVRLLMQKMITILLKFLHPISFLHLFLCSTFHFIRLNIAHIYRKFIFLRFKTEFNVNNIFLALNQPIHFNMLIQLYCVLDIILLYLYFAGHKTSSLF